MIYFTRRLLMVLFVLSILSPLPLCAEAAVDANDLATVTGEDGEFDRYRLGLEVKTHYRDSDHTRFPIPLVLFGEQLSLETVDAGDHVEVSVVSVEGFAQWTENLAGKAKIDFIDRYDRNPTSEDREIDVDEAWLRYGREPLPAEVPDRRSWYVKLGKFGKFERQDDRRLESYGLVSTSFNRLEDVGLEVGFDITPNFYVKGSFSQGNPLFFRDPNVLAGDNGTSVFNVDFTNPPDSLPISETKSGFPILYDADVDDIDFEHPEVGLGLGWRWISVSGFAALDVLAWGYERELADSVDLDNTFYGGDLDLLRGPGNAASLPISNDEKKEVGANLWLYLGGFSFFAQYVDQDLAGLDRTGLEFEAAWTFSGPAGWAVGRRQLFPWFTPVLRYSKLDPKFGRQDFPFVSVIWEWEKIDYGLRFAIIDEIDITIEWQDHAFIRLGQEESNDEFLITLTLDLERGWPGR